MDLKQSFEQRAKRLGLATSDESATEAAELDKFKGSKFWIWGDRDSHRKEYERSGCRCCFMHMLPSLPVKNGQEMPLFPWQQEVFETLEHNKLIAILKGRGVGGTQMLLLWAFYLCVRDDQMRGKNMIIVTGIREQLSLELIRRFKNIMPDLKWNTRENVAELNKCRLIAYPSKRVKDLRGLTDVALVICDEFDHYDINDQIQVRPILEALQVKSDATICLLSTPGAIGSEMNKLFDLKESECPYKRIYIPIGKVIGTLISEEEAAKVRNSPNYLQEFELRFSSYSANSIFSLADISRATEMGQRYATDKKYNPNLLPYPRIDYNDMSAYSIACDPGFGNSKTGIVMTAIMDGKLHVLVAEEYEKPNEDTVIRRLISLRQQTRKLHQTKIYVDSSAISFIRRLKACLPGERTDYENYIDELRKRRLVRPPDEAQLVHYMAVIPCVFSKSGAKLLATLYAFLQRSDLVIHPKFQTLISQLQSARNVPGRSSQFILDKSQNSLDSLDALRMCLWNFEAGPGAPEVGEEEEEEQEGMIVR